MKAHGRRSAARLIPGAWLFTCRAGAERDLCDELALHGSTVEPLVLAPALVIAERLPRGPETAQQLAFARQGFKVELLATPRDLDTGLSAQLATRLQGASAYALHCWTPDSPEGNARLAQARTLETTLREQLASALPQLPHVATPALSGQRGGKLLQLCLIDAQTLAMGLDAPGRTLSLAHGGRSRTSSKGRLPSRSARKLEEALNWFGTAPGPGELCVDLGAAPGGWTHVLASKGAKVIAVDPARLSAEVMTRRNVTHVRQNAFRFVPEEPADWLFCDMAYRPLEVAALLAKWGRERWARLLVANIKLPMTKKAEILWRVKDTLTQGDAWRNVRWRQLYHDRDEVTLTAYAT